MSEELISFHDLAHFYSDKNRISFSDNSIARDEHTLLLGASGKGKTTLLHLLAGLLPATVGEIKVLGQKINELNRQKLDRFRGQNFGLIFQNAHLIKSLTVLENLEIAALFGKTKSSKTDFEDLLERLDVRETALKKVTQISQGQAQRVAIARALVNRPKVIFCDEPTASLDDHSCVLVINLLKSQAELYGATLVIATHDHRIKSEFAKRIEL